MPSTIVLTKRKRQVPLRQPVRIPRPKEAPEKVPEKPKVGPIPLIVSMGTRHAEE